MQLQWISDLSRVRKRDWDALDHPPDYPFLEWEWLVRLERSGSVGRHVGWIPMHPTLWSDSRLMGAAAMYIKTHSQGEFVFDRIWADVADQLRLPYYPKLVGTSPFTPVPGYRFLYAPEADRDQVTLHLLQEMWRLSRRLGLGGVHFLFTDWEWSRRIQAHGFLPWRHQSYLWTNAGYADFDQFLATFRSGQRKNVRKERRAVQEQGIRIAVLTGEEISAEHMDQMYTVYTRTNERYGPWGCKFLTRDFFQSLVPALRSRLVLMQARDRDGQTAAMALFVLKNRALYGRYWGALASYPHLHFCLCYYEPIQWAIARKLSFFDPGAGSAHKAKRGFVAQANCSLHWLSDPTLFRVMQANMDQINALEQEYIDELNELAPFKREKSGTRS